MNKIISCICLFILIIASLLNPDKILAIGEIVIQNHSSTDTITARIYPISMVFNGGVPPFASNQYNLKAIYRNLDSPYVYSYINGRGLYQDSFNILPNDEAWFNLDVSNSNPECWASLSYGRYKIKLYYTDEQNNYWSDTCTIEYDAGYLQAPNPFSGDVLIGFRDNGSPRIVFKWINGSQEYNVSDFNKQIVCWDQQYSLDSNVRRLRTKDYGNFFYDSQFNNTYTMIPQDSRKDCGIENQNFADDRSGVLTLNLTINKNVFTRDTLINNPTNITVTKNTYLAINNDKVFNMITATNGTNNLIVQDSSLLLLKSGSQLIVGSGNKLTLQNKGKINLLQNSQLRFQRGSLFCNLGGLIKSLGGSIIYEIGSHVICREVVEYPIGDSTKLILEDSASLEIPDSTIMHFTGSQSALIMKPNSKLKLGAGSKILFDSSATLIANGATFTSLDSNENWQGIILSNSGIDSITNCIFSNAKTSLSFLNDANSSNTNRVIKGNTFNVPSGGQHKGIYGENNYRILIQDNIFNMPVYYPSGSPIALDYIGLYLKNNSTGGAAGAREQSQASPYSLNIIHNTFSNGCASVILANYTSNFLPYMVKSNTFNSTASSNLIGIKTGGTIKDNVFTSDNVPLGIHLVNSSPNLYNNSIQSKNVALHLTGHCYPNLAPYVSGSDLVWTGGKNTISTTDIDNIQLTSSGNVKTDWGNNNFNIDNSSAYHIYGWADSTMNTYYARNNCWNSGTAAVISLTRNYISNIVTPVFTNSGFECNSNASPEDWNVSYNGNGVYDSIKLTSDNTQQELSESEILNNAGNDYMGTGDYPLAIASYKSSIDNDSNYGSHKDATYALYACYQSLDTTSNQNYRNDLYGDLVIYLEDKISSDDYSVDFCDNAYDIILMCQANMGE